MRAAARARLPRPADGDRGRVIGRRPDAVPLDRDAPRPRLRRRVRGRVHAARRDRDVPRGPLVDYLAPLRVDRWRHPGRPGPEPRRHPAHPGPRTHVAAARRRRRGFARDRDGLDLTRGARERPEHGRSTRRTRRQRAWRLAGVVRARGDLRRRLDAVHRHHPGRDPDHGRHLDDHPPGHDPAGRLHAGPRLAVPRDRARLRPVARPAPAAHQARTGRLADRRPAGRVHRGRDDLRLAGALPRWFSFNTAI